MVLKEAAMWAVVVALAITMWMWVAASLHWVRWCFNKSDTAVQFVYLAAITALGAVALLLLPYLVLPGSVLSQGWTRELLDKTQFITIISLGVVASVALLRANFVLMPPENSNAKSISRLIARPGAGMVVKTNLEKKKEIKK
jgi:hypothetical protein